MFRESQEVPKLVDVTINHVKKSAQLTSCLIGISTLIVAAITLIGKWIILRDIHKEVVDQYDDHPTEPLYFTLKPFCDVLALQDFNVITFPVACALVILCTLVTKRISFMKKYCHGYGAPAMPFDFLLHSDRKLAAVIFAIIAGDLLDIVQSVINGSSRGNGVLADYSYRLAEVLYMALKYFPILAAVHINRMFVLICATVYTWLLFSFSIVEQSMCWPNYYPTYNDYENGYTDFNDKLKYYGTGPALIAIQLCTDIPKYLCFSYVAVKVPAIVIEKIIERRKKQSSDEKIFSKILTREENMLIQISHPDSMEMLYVRNLFIPYDQRPRSHALLARLLPKFLYEWRDDFRFSSRVLCIFASVFHLLFFVTIVACIEFVPSLQTLQDTIQELLDALINISFDEEAEVAVRSSFPLPNLVRPFLLAVAMTTTIMVIQLIVLLVNIRRNLLQAFRGDDSEIPRRHRSKYVSYATGNFHFAGYFIGYLVWGFIIIAFFSSIVCICLDAFVVYGSVRMLEKILKSIIPSILLLIFKLFLNKLLAQYVFLQHCGDVLALNNRRVLMIFIYFNFFLDAFLGFISSIIRLVKSILGGIIYMCRLDYSPLGRKLEFFDSGFSAYCGFIHTECTHRHPIMLVFVSHLFTEMKQRQLHRNDAEMIPVSEKEIVQRQKSLRYLRKWRLAAFLVRNPVVVFFRKTFLKQMSVENRRRINDLDNDNENNPFQAMAFYTRQMAVHQVAVHEDTNPSQIIIERL